MNIRKYVPLFFKPEEFRRCTPPCEVNDMDSLFLEQLDKARQIAGVPFILNSAYRSRDWELSHGRSGTSSHCDGTAVDIRCTDIYQRMRIVRALLKAGFDRIGIASTYIHVDSSLFRADNCIWLY